MKKIVLLFLLSFLFVSCSSKNNLEDENEVNNTWNIVDEDVNSKWLIEETSDIIEWYWDTLVDSIHDAKDIKNSIESRYNDLQNIPR